MASSLQRVKITLCPDSHFAQTKAKLWHTNNKTNTIQIELYISWSFSLRDLRRLFDFLLLSTADLYLAIACCAVAWPRMVRYKSRTFSSMRVSAGPPSVSNRCCNIMFSSISLFNWSRNNESLFTSPDIMVLHRKASYSTINWKIVDTNIR